MQRPGGFTELVACMQRPGDWGGLWATEERLFEAEETVCSKTCTVSSRLRSATLSKATEGYGYW